MIIDPEPPAPLISGPADLCSGHAGVQYSTSADGVDSYGWIIPPSAKIKSAQADSSIIILDFPQGVPAMVIQSFSKGMCRTAVSKPYAVAITQPPATPTAIEGETELCATRETTTYSAPPELSGGTYTWSFPPGFNMTSSASNAVTVGVSKQAKTGQISVTVSNACFTSAPMRLDVAILHEPEKPVIRRGTCDRQLLYEGDDDVVWYKDGQLLNEGTGIIDLHVADSGYYRIDTHNVCGKTPSETIYVLPVYPEDVLIPNVVTANSDGYNDNFLIDHSLQNSSLQIFNRWGTRVYYAPQYDNTWNGNNLSPGVYFFTLRNKCMADPLSGTIHLVK